MTLMGKIFTVLIFVMSIVFMSFAVMVFATHKNWKEIATSTTPVKSTGQVGLKTQLEQAYQARRTLEAELEGYKTQLAEHQAARRAALATLQVKVEGLADDLNKAQQNLTTLQAAHTEAVQKLGVAEANVSRAIAEAEALRTDIVTIEQDRNDKLGQATKLQDTVNQATGKLQQLEERRQQLLAQIAQQKKVMDAHGLTVSTLVEKLAPTVEGKVTAVNENGLLQINIGRDDGLVKGHTLEVYRGSEYLGKIIIRAVEANASVGEIIPATKKGPIRQGDSVATRIS